jgi:hypothetical protein
VTFRGIFRTTFAQTDQLYPGIPQWFRGHATYYTFNESLTFDLSELAFLTELDTEILPRLAVAEWRYL